LSGSKHASGCYPKLLRPSLAGKFEKQFTKTGIKVKERLTC